MGESGTFVRPASVPKKVWHRYSSFRIEDIPDNRRDEAIQHMIDNFFKDEPTTSVLKKTAPFSDEDRKKFLNAALDDNISLYAVDEDNNDEIAGVTILRVVSRAAPHKHEKVDSTLTSMNRLMSFLEYCHEGLDVFTYDSGSSKVVVDHVLEPMGLSVSPQYRGKGIGQALIRARHRMAAEVGIGATMGIYTSIYSQAIILRQGMHVVKEIPYDSYLENGVPVFKELNPPHPSCKVIGGLLPKPAS
ncbi:uncharacterized protein LOC124162746 [Ischnura elegans]|uniref:uncharacterized protein LOC124162746 n=1 Tax=Ischnura elegans TaxID=197161 RepID=UPI001ED8797B|nr:uncharacterized protein LOC124162746 [Ischnura elegans]